MAIATKISAATKTVVVTKVATVAQVKAKKVAKMAIIIRK